MHAYLEPFTVAGNLWYLGMEPVDKSLIALLQQTICLIQDKEPTLPAHSRGTKVILNGPVDIRSSSLPGVDPTLFLSKTQLQCCGSGSARIPI